MVGKSQGWIALEHVIRFRESLFSGCNRLHTMAPPMLRDAGSGIWGFPTSTMDWCEENYAVTHLIAEFWNTVSNIIFIVPPLLAARFVLDSKIIERRYVFAHFLLATVGFGSLAFHCTLLHSSQLLDELPMIYGTSIMLYNCFESNAPPKYLNKPLAAFLSMLSLVITTVYVTVSNPEFFLWAYGLMAASLFVASVYFCCVYRASWRLLMSAQISYSLGFVLWNIDNEMCMGVREIRAILPFFIAPITQLHAWWHFFAGVGTYLSIVFSINLRLTCLGYNSQLVFLHGWLPAVRRGASLYSSKSYENGACVDINDNQIMNGRNSPKLRNGVAPNAVHHSWADTTAIVNKTFFVVVLFAVSRGLFVSIHCIYIRNIL